MYNICNYSIQLYYVCHSIIPCDYMQEVQTYSRRVCRTYKPRTSACMILAACDIKKPSNSLVFDGCCQWNITFLPLLPESVSKLGANFHHLGMAFPHSGKHRHETSLTRHGHAYVQTPHGLVRTRGLQYSKLDPPEIKGLMDGGGNKLLFASLSKDTCDMLQTWSLIWQFHGKGNK